LSARQHGDIHLDPIMEPSMSLTIKDLKPYVPARDFELSKRFYSALGFTMSEGWGGTADFELGGHRFRLQNYYVPDWADNFMIVMGVDDVEAWHRRAKELASGGEFPGIRIKAPEPVDGSLVLHVVDPSGVLLIFVQ
jgi:predicted enzyme related to lactoylglutathione lyase